MDIKPIETYYNGYRFRSRLEARWAVFFDALGVKYEYEPEGFKLPSGRMYLPDFRVKCYDTRGWGPINHPIFPCIGCKHNHYHSVDFADVFNGLCDLFNPDTAYMDADPMPWATLRRPPERNEIVGCTRREQREKEWFWLYIEVKGVMTAEDASKIKEFANMKSLENHNPILIVGNIPQIGCAHDSMTTGAYDQMNNIDIYPFNYELIDGDYFAAYPAAHNGKFYLWGDDSNYINQDDVPVVEAAYTVARQARFEHGETPMANQSIKEISLADFKAWLKNRTSNPRI